MGHREPDTDFQSARHRIDAALATLRTELRALQQQDLSLLKQLLHIQHRIDGLSGRRDIYRRSYSSSSLSSACPPQPLSPVHKSASSGHLLLSRVHSEPISEAIEEGKEDDLPYHTFNGISVTSSRNDGSLESEMTDLLSPLPVECSRKRALSSTESTTAQQSASSPATHRAQVRSWHGFVIPQYSLSYETLLKHSTDAWKSVQQDKQENGTVDSKKMATLKLFL